MKNYLRLTGLMMSVMLCVFTSCTSEEGEDDKGDTGVASVQVDMLVASETLEWIAGTFVVTFSPSGMTKEINANELMFAIDANPVTDADYLKKFKSTHVKKASVNALCNRSDTKISIRPKLKVKAGKVASDGVYDYEVTGVISYQKSMGAVQKTSDYKGQRGLKGTAAESYLNTIGNMDIVWLNVK